MCVPWYGQNKALVRMPHGLKTKQKCGRKENIGGMHHTSDHDVTSSAVVGNNNVISKCLYERQNNVHGQMLPLCCNRSEVLKSATRLDASVCPPFIKIATTAITCLDRVLLK